MVDSFDNYKDAMMHEICELLADSDYPLEWVKNLAHDLPREYEGLLNDRAEAAWEERSAPDDGPYLGGG